MQGVKNSMRYEQIEHTGDIGIKVYGATLPDIFINAAAAMFEVMLEAKKSEVTLADEIEVTGDNHEELLVNWLSELNYIFSTENKVFNKFEISRITNTELAGVAMGEKFSPYNHKMKTEIKAVTYHEIYLKQIKDRWEAQVIFDI